MLCVMHTFGFTVRNRGAPNIFGFGSSFGVRSDPEHSFVWNSPNNRIPKKIALAQKFKCVAGIFFIKNGVAGANW